ncbi:MAG: DsrE family protein [Deltaproteobacteria bacterium]|nr:DsrE family protein [Deltaproteobacteria bacterium]MBW2072190.1 DsrE family protein [Deltaproteobacteria bacterium]
MKVLFIISTDDAETMYNALRMANVGLKKGDEVGVFMLGKAVTYESLADSEFDVIGQVNQFTEEGDFYV